MAIALLLTSGIVSGLYAIPVGGGFRSLPGLLNAVLVTQFLIIATLLKFSILEPMDENLSAPVATSTVMAIGFLGLLIGTWLHRRTPAPSSPLIPEVRGSAIFLALTILCLVFGYGGYFIGMSPYLDGDDEIKTGGILGGSENFRWFRLVHDRACPVLSMGTRIYAVHEPSSCFKCSVAILDSRHF